MSITFFSPTSPEHLELNVSNRNGYVILRELLDQVDVECYGSLNASTTLRSLAVARCRVMGIVRPTTDTRGERVVLSSAGVAVEKTCRVIDFGISGEQVERYIDRLTVLAQWAVTKGEAVSYG